MSKGPDLSAFPIPRKGGARPIGLDDTPSHDEPAGREGEGGRPSGIGSARSGPDRRDEAVSQPQPVPKGRPLPPLVTPQPSVSGQVVATTVKLDEGRYLRLVNAGQPGPGRLKRRTIQEMMVEAIDEWFDRRGL